jgi:hypothetical protein
VGSDSRRSIAEAVLGVLALYDPLETGSATSTLSNDTTASPRLCMCEVFINFHIFFSETVMTVCIQCQVGGVLIWLNNDPLSSISCAFAIILTFFWVVNNLFPSVESP